jgi:hypothetical protein
MPVLCNKKTGGRGAGGHSCLSPSLLQMKINPQDMLAGEERRAFWDILRDNNVFVFCLKKRLHFLNIFLGKSIFIFFKKFGRKQFCIFNV